MAMALQTAPSLPPRMFAWQYAGTSPTIDDHLVYKTDVPTPEFPTKDSTPACLIQVLAASLNPADFKVPEIPIAGRLANGAPPVSPAKDFVGRIVATTATAFRLGDLVVGSTWAGALGQYLVCPADGIKASLAKVPDELARSVEGDSRRLAELAGLSIGGLTAFQSLSNLPRGASVFVNGGSGGVGTFTVQLAKILGAGRVAATCSGRNIELMRGLGVDDVVDYRTTGDVVTALADLTKGEGREGFDLVVDNIGTMNLYFRAHEYVREGGRYVLVGSDVSLSMAFSILKAFLLPSFLGGGRRKLEPLMLKHSNETLQRLIELVAEGKLKVVVDEIFPCEEAVAAFKKLRSGRAKGKIIISLAE